MKKGSPKNKTDTVSSSRVGTVLADSGRTPLGGREAEFRSVLRFLDARCRLEHSKALFVFGACGCGKTSTVLRAMRAVHAKPLPCDEKEAQAAAGAKRRRAQEKDEEEQQLLTTKRRVDHSPSNGKDGSDAAEGISPTGRGSSNRNSAGGPSADRVLFADGEEEEQHYSTEFPALFAHLSKARVAAGRGPVQAHYLNCADLSPQQLADSLLGSMKQVYHRPTDRVAQLMEQLASLPDVCTRSGRSKNRVVTAPPPAASSSGAAKRKGAPPTTLQVFVLDEVEYVRPAARAALTELASLSFSRPSELALVFISNQRDLVHVPAMMMEELAFGAYALETLKQIGAEAVQQQLRVMSEEEGIAGDAVPLVVSPSLYDYIARKALLDHSGDVRQVLAMCRRVVHTAFQEWKLAAATAPPRGKGRSAISRNMTATQQRTLRTKLEAVVDMTTPSSPSGRGSTGAAGAEGTSLNCSPARSSTSSAVAAAGPTSVVSLARSVKVLKAGSVEHGLAQHMAAMPEQMLFVLSSLIVLALRQQQEHQRRAVAIGGTVGSAQKSPDSGASLTRRQVAHAYTALMGRLHFPAMNGAGVSTTIDSLADLGIVTRPQQRGNEEVFSFNGTWTLDAMQTALVDRGEAIRSEMESCGLDGGENKLLTVLRELRAITGMA